jgi:hypothetical protein
MRREGKPNDNQMTTCFTDNANAQKDTSSSSLITKPKFITQTPSKNITLFDTVPKEDTIKGDDIDETQL